MPSGLQLRASDGTVWLTLPEMAELFGTTSQNIGQLVRRVLDDGEVDEATTKRDFVVRSEGPRQVRREVTLHNLDLVLAVGYRATSERAMQFRQWATSVLREYLVKGSRWTTRSLRRRMDGTTSTSGWNGSAPSGPRRSASTKRFVTCTRRRSTMTRNHQARRPSSLRSRTRCCGPSPGTGLLWIFRTADLIDFLRWRTREEALAAAARAQRQCVWPNASSS